MVAERDTHALWFDLERFDCDPFHRKRFDLKRFVGKQFNCKRLLVSDSTLGLRRFVGKRFNYSLVSDSTLSNLLVSDSTVSDCW